MSKKVNLADMIEELESEWERRNREYPDLIAKGEMKTYRVEAKQERLQAAIHTLCWLAENRELLLSYMAHMRSLSMTAEQVADTADEIEAEFAAMVEAERAKEVAAEAERLEKARMKALAEETAEAA